MEFTENDEIEEEVYEIERVRKYFEQWTRRRN